MGSGREGGRDLFSTFLTRPQSLFQLEGEGGFFGQEERKITFATRRGAMKQFL